MRKNAEYFLGLRAIPKALEKVERMSRNIIAFLNRRMAHEQVIVHKLLMHEGDVIMK